MANPKNPNDTKKQESNMAKQGLQQHPLVDKVLPDPSQQRSLSILTGFPAKSPAEGYSRLYLDPSLGSCVDIPEEDIVHSESMDKSPFQPTAVWVRSDSKLQYRNLTPSEVQASFLSGQIAGGNLASAARSYPSIASRLTNTRACRPSVDIVECPSNARTSCGDVCPGGGDGGGSPLSSDQKCIVVSVGSSPDIC
jgi:hypothetical protein